MDLQTRKISFVQEFLKLQNEEIVKSLEKILQKKKKELSAKAPEPMTKERLREEVRQSMEDIKNGRVIEHSELKAEILKRWR